MGEKTIGLLERSAQGVKEISFFVGAIALAGSLISSIFYETVAGASLTWLAADQVENHTRQRK